MPDLVEISVEDGVALLRLNRPDARNALSRELREEIASGLERLASGEEARCAVIAGSDRFFAAGADIKAMAERPLDAAPDPEGIRFWERLTEVAIPTVAAVSGYALGGGCELALACDMIVADEEARFGQPEIMLGIIPGGGGSQRLARTIGKQRAMEYVLTGRPFDAATALEWGLVNRLAPAGECLRAALELARDVAARAPLAARYAKRAVLAAERTTLQEGLRAERELFDRAMASEDRVEGMRAFLEKRDPEFKGR